MANLGTIQSGVMVGFSANKTETQAKADKATNRVDICTTKQLYLNGERIGLTDDEASIVKGLVSDKKKAEDDAKFTIALNIGSATSAGTLSSDKKIFEKDKKMSVVLTATLMYNGQKVKSGYNTGGTPETTLNLTVKSGSTTTTKTMTWDGTNSVYTTGSNAIEIDATTTFSVSGNVGYSSTKTATLTFTAGGYVYVGRTKTLPVAITSGDAFADLTLESATTGLKTTLAGSYTFAFASGEYAVLVVPKTLTSRGRFNSASGGVYNAVQGVANVPFLKQSTTVTKNGVECEVFYLSAAQAAGSQTYTI